MPLWDWFRRRREDGGERRRTPRCKALHLSLVRASDQSGKGQVQVMGRTRDLGEGGALIEVGQDLAAGSWVDISLGIGDQVIQAWGEVLACSRSDGEGHLLRVEFHDLDQDGREALRAYCQERSAEREPASVVL